MKSTSVLHVMLYVIAAGFICPRAEAEKKPDFTELRGRYSGSGTVSVVNPEGETTSSGAGPVTITINVPRSGRSAEIIVNGAVVVEGNSVPLFGRIRMSGRRNYQIGQFLFSVLDGPGARGKFKAMRNKTTFSAPWTAGGDSGRIVGSLAVSRNGKLRLDHTLNIDAGGQYLFNFQASRRVR